MNAPVFPLNPTVGERFMNWVWSGAQWVCSPASGVQVITQVFLTNGPYMPSPGLVTAVVECYGGGAGGGWAGPTPSVEWAVAGGGGGSGGYSRKTLPAALVAGGVNVTVAQVVPGSSAGQTTSFGALCVAYGGAPGNANDFATGGGAGGAGAPPGIGDVAVPGTFGGNGDFSETPPTSEFFAISGGIGGFLLGGMTTVNVGPGNASGSQNARGTTGAGGGGGAVNQVIWANLPPIDIPNGHISGGNGAAGMCIVTEYCWADVNPNEDCCGDFNVNARVAVTDARSGRWSGGPYVDPRPGQGGGGEQWDFTDE